MKIKSPKEPIVLSDKSFDDLENILKKNEERNRLNKKEKELLAVSRNFDCNVRLFFNE